MSILSRLPGRVGLGELLLLAAIGLLSSGIWYFWTLPAFVIQSVEIEYQEGLDQLTISITPKYRGGCETVRLVQWAENDETGEVRRLSDYTGPPRAKVGTAPVEHIIRTGKAFSPGEWIWHAEAVCTHQNGGQELFFAPPTRFFVEGPT